MKIPDKIRICGIDYDVIIKKFNDESKYGRTYERTASIHLNSNLNIQVKEETFLHEIFHIINWVSEVGLDEKQVSVMARILYQMLKDNDLLKE